MASALEKQGFSPDPSPSVPKIEPRNGSFEKTVVVEGQPYQIRLAYNSSGLRLTAFLPDATGADRTLGTAVASHEVVNTDILRIISFQQVSDSPNDSRLALHSQLFRFAAEHGLRILPWTEHWSRMEQETRRWLDDNQLADASTSPNI
jgi:hypothetical protein